jgi:hypothetical protein
MGQVVFLCRMMVQNILPYFFKNFPIYGTLWISSFIHHIALEKDYKGLGSIGPHRAPKIGPKTIEGQLGYGNK